MWQQIKTVIFLGFLTGILLIIGYLVGGQQGLFIALMISVLINFFTYWFSDKIVLLMYRAKKAEPKSDRELISLVKEVCKHADIPQPKVYVIPSEHANAFATGRSKKHAAVAVTKGIMNLLSRDELKGVIAHEIAHVKNRDILISTIAATIAGAISYLAFMARYAGLFGGNDREGRGGNIIGLILLGIIAPIIALIIQLAISRSREYLADSTGAKIVKNPNGLASALKKLSENAKTNPLRFGNSATSHLFIVNPFSARGLIHLFSTHPPLEERIKKLNEMKI